MYVTVIKQSSTVFNHQFLHILAFYSQLSMLDSQTKYNAFVTFITFMDAKPNFPYHLPYFPSRGFIGFFIK